MSDERKVTTDRRKQLVEGHSPALRDAGIGTLVNTVSAAALVAGADGADPSVALALTNVAAVHAIVAFTTADGTVATKTLLAEGTDFSVVDGVLTADVDLSGQTLLVLYSPLT